MSRNTAGILLIGAAALWYGVLRGVNAVKVAFENLQLTGVNSSLSALLFRISVLINNPLWISVPIDEIVGDVYIMQEHVASVNQTMQQSVAARSISRINVGFEAYLDKLGYALWQNILTGDINTIVARFSGYVKIKGVKIPVNREFNIQDMRA